MKYLLILALLISCSSKTRECDVKCTDLNLLLILGQGECSICNEEELINIMSVAMNRVRSKQFPNTLYEVVYQKNQFHGMYREHNESINMKVCKAAEYVLKNGSVLDTNILGFLEESKIKNEKWYNQIKDSILFKNQYHSFYTL